MVAQIQVIEANPWCQENQTKSSMRGKQRWFLRRRAHRARAERRALSSRVASCLVSTGIPLKVLLGYRKWSQSPRRVAISSQLSWSCTFGHWNISRCSVSKLDGQSTNNMYGSPHSKTFFHFSNSRGRDAYCSQDFFFWDNSRALQPKAFLAVGKLDKNHCNTEGLRISGNFFSPKWWRSMHLLALVTLGSMLCLRQQLLHVEIFEVQVPLQMELEDEWVGRLGATVLNR